MSGIGRTNSGSGGGGISPNRITIHVNAPKGSTVAFSLSGSIVKTIPSNKAVLNADGRTADYYYNPSATGTYTITASLGSLSQSKTITVSTVGEYDVTIKFLLLYDYGDECSDLTGGWTYSKYGAGTASLVKNADNMVISGSTTTAASTNVCANMANLISMAGFSTLKIIYSQSRTGSVDNANICLQKVVPTSGGYESDSNVLVMSTLTVGTDKVVTCNISNVTVNACTVVRFWVHSNHTKSTTITIKRVWLE